MVNRPSENQVSEGFSPAELIERKPLIERGRELYKLWGRTVEQVLGEIKNVGLTDLYAEEFRLAAAIGH